jgi:Sjoegren syndrome nuclear autoantigen 1
MASQGASLQNYNNQLVKCIEDLREKREEVNKQILKEEEEKAKIQKDLAILTERLSKLNESLQRKQQARSEYDQTIQETEAAYMKILESSQTLLHVLKRESVNLVSFIINKKNNESRFSLNFYFLNLTPFFHPLFILLGQKTRFCSLRIEKQVSWPSPPSSFLLAFLPPS